MQTRDKDLIKPILQQLTEQYRRNPDPNATLATLNNNLASGPGLNLLLYTVSETKDGEAVKTCLALLTDIAWNERTDIKALITMLTTVLPEKKMTVGGYITTSFKSNTIMQHLLLLDAIAKRSDVTPELMSKLIGDHSQYNGKLDKTIAHNLVCFKKHDNLKQYLTTLVKLAAEKKIDDDTIWNALRKPKGATDNIGALIAEQYHEPDCIFLLTQLTTYLNAAQVEALMPHHYNRFKNSFMKENLRDHIKTLSPEQQIKACRSALTKGSALYKIFMCRRGSDECSETKGTMKDLTAILGLADYALSQQGVSIAPSVVREAPQPSAPPINNYESEYTALYSKAPPPEQTVAPATDLMGLNESELGERLRKAASDGKTETVRVLLQHRANVDFHKDLASDFLDASALYMAAQEGHNETVILLLESGAKPNLCRRNGMGPLAAAALSGHAETVNMLLRVGADATAITREKNSPLMLAAVNGHAEVIDALIAHLISHYSHHDVLAFMAADNHFRKCMEQAKNGASLLALQKYIKHLEAEKVSADVINELVPATNTYKEANLKESVVEHIKSLPVSERPAICAEAANEKTLLGKFMYMPRGLTSAGRGHGTLATIEEIHYEALNINELLISAILGADHPRIRQLLDENGIDINLRSALYTPLIAAAQIGNKAIVEELLQRGADTSITLNIHRNSLQSAMEAFSRALKDRFQAMLDEDKSKNKFTLSPEKIAELYGKTEIATLIRAHKEALAQKQAEAAAAAEAEAAAAASAPSFAPEVAASLYPRVQEPTFIPPYALQEQQYARPPVSYEAKPVEYASAPANETVTDVLVADSAPASAPEAVQVTSAEIAPEQPAAEPLEAVVTTEAVAEQTPVEVKAEAAPAASDPTTMFANYAEKGRALREAAAPKPDLLDLSSISEAKSEPIVQSSALDLLFGETSTDAKTAPLNSTALLIDFMSAETEVMAVSAPVLSQVNEQPLISFDFMNEPRVETREPSYNASALLDLSLFTPAAEEVAKPEAAAIAQTQEAVAPPAPELTEEQKEAALMAQLDALPPAPKDRAQQEDIAPHKEKRTESKKAVATLGY